MRAAAGRNQHAPIHPTVKLLSQTGARAEPAPSLGNLLQGSSPLSSQGPCQQRLSCASSAARSSSSPALAAAVAAALRPRRAGRPLPLQQQAAPRARPSRAAWRMQKLPAAAAAGQACRCRGSRTGPARGQPAPSGRGHAVQQQQQQLPAGSSLDHKLAQQARSESPGRAGRTRRRHLCLLLLLLLPALTGLAVMLVRLRSTEQAAQAAAQQQSAGATFVGRCSICCSSYRILACHITIYRILACHVSRTWTCTEPGLRAAPMHKCQSRCRGSPARLACRP